MLLSSALVSGLALGSMYGLIALGFHVTYAVSGTVNFAQGSSMMLGRCSAFLAVTLGWPALAGCRGARPVRALRLVSSACRAALRARGSDAG